MHIVVAMQAYAGPIQAWPSSLLQIIFAYDLKHPAYFLHHQQIISYFGNNVPFYLACQFFSAYLTLSWIVPRFRYHYELFEQHPFLSRCPYYNIGEGRVKYTDGTVEGPHANLPITIGFEGTGYTVFMFLLLLTKLGLLKRKLNELHDLYHR